MAGARGKHHNRGEHNRPKRTYEGREQDLAEMAKLLARGWPRGEIARHMKVSPSTITYDWKEVLRRLNANRDKDAQAAVDRKMAEYAEVKREAWAAWERSKEDTESQRTEEGETGKGPFTKNTLTKAGRLPGAEYLVTILNCLKAERELQGLDPIKQVAVTNVSIDWGALSAEIDGKPVDAVEARMTQLLTHQPDTDELRARVVETVAAEVTDAS